MVKAAVKKIKKATVSLNGQSNGVAVPTERLDVKKTYKLYIDGKFPRTESGRFTSFKTVSSTVNICRSSRKDLRDAIVSNRKALEGWSNRSAYNKGQILYRIAETLESRKAQFIDTFRQQGMSPAAAKTEIEKAVDLLVYYAGWTDKYIQIFSGVNPVESSHFNFSYPEPTGVTVIYPAENSGLVSFISAVAPVIAGGNTCTVIVSGNYPLTVIDFAEVLNASDVPGGVVNILTGQRKELLGPAAMHMDINAIITEDLTAEQRKTLQIQSAANLKRLIDFSNEAVQSPYRILNCQEIKTTWHPIGI
jgi:acyl-CoA reductase-like NAD-dependent aldehyde dehydrogenase